jgi:hypothetical protein
MRARFRISTNRGLLHNFTLAPASQFLWPAPKFITDSKPLKGLRRPDFQRQKTFFRTVFVNGLERAFTKMPANLKVFHPETPRREL